MSRSLGWGLGYVLVLGLIVLFLFSSLHRAPVAEWDEARYGINALEMKITGDWINYHYQGELDLWNAKPPLQVWAIAGANEVFGPGEFSLRIPSALAAFLFFLIALAWGKELGGWPLGLWFLGLAALNRNVIGHHVGLSGDMDALFVLGIALGDFYLRRLWLHHKAPLLSQPQAIWQSAMVGIGFSIAFWSKGFAFLILAPGYLVLAFPVWRSLLRDVRVWVASLVLLSLVGLWLGLSAAFGKSAPVEQFGSHSALGVMVFYDIGARFFGGMEGYESRNPMVLMGFMDTRLGAIYYALLLLLVVSVLASLKVPRMGSTPDRLEMADRPSGNSPSVQSLSELERLNLRWALVCSFGFLGVLALSATKFPWYLAPLSFWLVVVLWFGGKFYISRFPWMSHWPLVLVLALVVNTVHLWRTWQESFNPSPIQAFVRENQKALGGAGRITLQSAFRQDEYLYLMWARNSDQVELRSIGTQIAFPEKYELRCEKEECLIFSQK